MAAALANRIYEDHTSKGETVEIVAHSMGGLISRVALLGSAKGWAGFPDARLKVDDIATLATPHQGIFEPNKYDSVQWNSMVPGSRFMTVLHEPANRLDQVAPGGGKYNLRYWHSSEGTPHDTTNGWAPLETAFNALVRDVHW